MMPFDRVALRLGVVSIVVVLLVLLVGLPQVAVADKPWVLVVGIATLLVGLTSAWWAVQRGRR